MEFQYSIPIAAALLFGAAAWQSRRTGESAAQHGLFRALWGAILLGFVGYTLLSYLTVIQLLSSDPEEAIRLGLDTGAPTRGLVALGFALITALFLWLWVHSLRLRLWVSRLFPPLRPDRLNDITAQPWPDQIRGFDPQSTIHALAVGAALLLWLQTLVDFIIAGGQSGPAAGDLNQNQVVISSALTAAMLLLVTFLGVGIGLDRSPRQALARLGLRWPTLSEVSVGAGVAITLVGFQFCASAIWVATTPEKLLEQQMEFNRAITGSVTTLSGAFLVALLSSFSEEIAFRGGLQPVIGLGPTALLFALMHAQYQFTPAALIILVVGLFFGLLRQQFGTGAAITAHFVYNFVLLSLAALSNQLMG